MSPLACAPNLLLALYATLIRELRKVEGFYVDRLTRVQQSIAALRAWYGIDEEYGIDIPLQQVNHEELRDLLRKSSALLANLQKVFQYGELNRQGFSRISRKLEEFCAQHDSIFSDYDMTEAHCINQAECLKDIDALRNFVVALWPACVCDPPYSALLSLRLKTLCSRSHPFSDCVEDLCQAIGNDEASNLQQILRTNGIGFQKMEVELQPLLFDLLEYSVLCLSRNCVDALTKYIRSPAPTHRAGTGNIIHRLTEAIGLGIKPVMYAELQSNEPLPVSKSTKLGAQLLSDIVHALAGNARPALDNKNCFGRSPLHYAALYGLTGLCSAYLEHMETNRDASSSQNAQPAFSPDADGLTALHLSAFGGHLQTTQSILEFSRGVTPVDGLDLKDELDPLVGEALSVALCHLSDPQRSHLARYLISTLPKVDDKRPDGQTALYFAAKYGCQEVLQEVLARVPQSDKFLDTPDSIGWTPLIVACVEGHFGAVKILIQSGADPDLRDSLDWTAKEHAAFRGHLGIAKWLADLGEGEQVRRHPAFVSGIDKKVSLRPLPSNQSQLPVAKGKTQILLTLGPSNTRSKLQAADVSPMLIYQNKSPCDHAGYALQIRSVCASGPTPLIRLPILEDTINDPWWFSTEDTNGARFVFNLVRLNGQNDGDCTLIASAIAVLKDLKRGFSFQHESLSRDYTIPLLQKESLRFAGTITFSFLIITPLPCPCVPSEAKTGFWKTDGSTQIVGHRGTSACTTQDQESSH